MLNLFKEEVWDGKGNESNGLLVLSKERVILGKEQGEIDGCLS